MHAAFAHMSTSPRMLGTEGSLLATPLLPRDRVAVLLGTGLMGHRHPRKARSETHRIPLLNNSTALGAAAALACEKPP